MRWSTTRGDPEPWRVDVDGIKTRAFKTDKEAKAFAERALRTKLTRALAALDAYEKEKSDEENPGH